MAFKSQTKIGQYESLNENFYPGVIKRKNRDGTYDVDYDDGKKEMFVAEEFIKHLESVGSSVEGNCGGGDDGFQQGMKVEARYRGDINYPWGIHFNK
jgi:hypothetical protein